MSWTRRAQLGASPVIKTYSLAWASPPIVARFVRVASQMGQFVCWLRWCCWGGQVPSDPDKVILGGSTSTSPSARETLRTWSTRAADEVLGETPRPRTLPRFKMAAHRYTSKKWWSTSETGASSFIGWRPRHEPLRCRPRRSILKPYFDLLGLACRSCDTVRPAARCNSMGTAEFHT